VTDLTPERALELVELNIRWRNQDEAGTLARAEDVLAVLRDALTQLRVLKTEWADMEPEYGVYVLGTETPVDPNTEENARETAKRLSQTEPSTFPHEPVRRYSTNWDYI
jgi:hypothetical protein